MSPSVGQARIWTHDRVVALQVWTGTEWADMQGVVSVALARVDQRMPEAIATIEVVLDYGATA